MRILFTIHQFFPKYASGTEVLTLETASELIKRGHDVRIITAEPADYDTALNIPYFVNDYDGIITYRINHHLGIYDNPVYYEYCNEKIELIVSSILKEFRPDIVHIMHSSRLSAAIIDSFRNEKIPIVMTATDFWFICPMSQMRLPDNTPCKGPNINSTNCLKCYVNRTQTQEINNKISKIPLTLLTLINGISKFSFVERWEKGIMVRALVRRKAYMINQINKVDRIIAPTSTMVKLLSTNGVRKNKITKISFGLNNKYLKKQYDIKKYNGIIKFGFIGTLYEHKGAHILIKAFKELEKAYDNIELKIYGDLTHFPEYIKYLKSISDEDEKIKFLGTFPNSAIGDVFEDIDVLVVPSIWYENTPLVIYSAFSTKTPVIATNLGGMTEVVHDNQNGLVFQREDFHELRDKMEKFLLDTTLLERMSAGINEVKNIEQNVNELEDEYSEVLRTYLKH